MSESRNDLLLSSTKVCIYVRIPKNRPTKNPHSLYYLRVYLPRRGPTRGKQGDPKKNIKPKLPKPKYIKNITAQNDMTVLNLHVEKITDGSHKERLKSFHRTASHAVRGSNPVLCHKRPFVLVHKFEKGSSRKHNISSHCQDHSGYASSVEGIPAGRNFPPFLNDQLRLQQLRQKLVRMFKRCTLINAQQIHDFLAIVPRG